MGCACGTGGNPSFEGAGTSGCTHHRNDAGTANQTDVNHLDSGSKTKKYCTWLTICVLWRIPRQMGQVNSAFNFRVESVCVLGPVTCDTNLILHKSCLA